MKLVKDILLEDLDKDKEDAHHTEAQQTESDNFQKGDKVVSSPA